MYKETIASIVIIILIFTTDYITNNFAEKNVNLIKDKLQELSIILQEKNYENAGNKINDIENDWQKIKNKFACFIEHTELNKIETSFTLCKSLVKSQEYSLAISKLDETIFVLEHMTERYSLSLENIF